MKRYDAIVIGAGAGGGVAACVLAEAGFSVLVVERGRRLHWWDEPRDHLRNHRLSTYGHNTGPDLEGNPRVIVERNHERTVKPHEGGYHANAAAVGSGTLVYGGQAWRFHPLDFKMATTYGVPAGSSLVDWPISYQDLAPYYERAEWDLGVAGGDSAPQMPTRSPYPMPAVQRTAKAKCLEGGAVKLGWSVQTPPLLINTVPRGGRDACAGCQHCVGFQCPTNAKNGTQNTVIPRALATGRCELVTEAMVLSIENEAGTVSGIRYQVGNELKSASASFVIVAGGAIETARLLMLSGLGNDQVGRHLQGHYYSGSWGLMPEPIWDGMGPGVSISTLEFSHGNKDIIGGGMLADDFITLPIIYAKNYRPASIPEWGLAHKQWMRDSFTRFVQIIGPVHEIPNPDARVTLHPSVRDKFGLPVARLSGTAHPETVRTTEFLTGKGREWLIASGAEEVWSRQAGLHLSGGQHQAGTCRMGEDPKSSVVDPFGRVHGMSNLYIADSSVHPTNGGFNPVLTIMAMAYRTSTLLVQNA